MYGVVSFYTEEPIDIVVADPQTKEGQFNKFTTYMVKGTDRNGQFEV